MSAAISTRWMIGLLLAPVFLVAGFGLLVLWNGWWVLNALGFFGDAPVAYDTPTKLARISVPARPGSLAWSADGKYLAAGTWGRSTGETEPGEVYVVDVAKESVLATLKTKSWVQGLAFSPDGKWLAVAMRPPSMPSTPAGSTPVELVAYDVPMFKPQFTAQAGSPQRGFIDVAWAADSKSLLAIDGPVDNAGGNAEVRRWNVPDFAEQRVVRALQIKGDAALAVSPDGRTVAVSYGDGDKYMSLVRLVDVEGGAERPLFRPGDIFQCPRLGFTADGKAVGIFDINRLKLSWWDVATGGPAKSGGHFAVQPAGLSEHRSRASVSPDGSMAGAYERHRGFGDLGFDNRGNEFGSFIKVTSSATAKTQTWRVGEAQEAPIVALAPDGKKLAGAIRQPSGAEIVVWAVPK